MRPHIQEKLDIQEEMLEWDIAITVSVRAPTQKEAWEKVLEVVAFSTLSVIHIGEPREVKE